MPIKRILPNGRIEIFNNKTGETAEVAPQELGTYNPRLIEDYNKLKSYNDSVSSGAYNVKDVPEAIRPNVMASVDTVEAGKKKIYDKAQGVLDVLNKKDTMTPEQYQDALNYAASEFNKRGFEEGGKNLTGTERSILSGGMINLTEQKPNLLDRVGGWFTGETPAIRSRVGEDENSVRNKMMIAQGKQPQAPMGQPKKEYSIGGLAGNAMREVNDMGQGLVDTYQYVRDNPQDAPRILSQATLNNAIPNLIKGTFDTIKSYAPVSEENGRMKFDVGKTLDTAYEKPIQTAALLYPFAEKAVPKAMAGRIPEGLKGRAATSVAVPDTTSVKNSRALMGKALQMTDSPTMQGTAVQLEDVIPKAGEFIKNYTKSIDSTIGPQMLDDVEGTIRTALKDDVLVRNNPDIAERVMKDFRAYAKEGDVQMKYGIPDNATSMSGINEARMKMNKDLSRWFKAGMPEDTPANIERAMRFKMSTLLKDMMSEADDGQGYFKKALDMQHTAFKTSPTMSEKSMATSTPHSLTGAVVDAGRNIFSPFKMWGARAAQGTDAMASEILKGKVPAVNAPPAFNPFNEFKTAAPSAAIGTKTPLEGAQDVKGPSRTIKRDMRYKQGNFRPRN